MKAINDADSGYSTQGWMVPQLAIDRGLDVDRIIIFTDMQMYGRDNLAAKLMEYRRRINHPVWLYLFDLRGYGTSQMHGDDKHTYLMAGWSDRVFEFMRQSEQDPNVVVEKIRNYPEEALALKKEVAVAA